MDTIKYLNQNIYIPNGIDIEDLQEEIQNNKYNGYRFSIDDRIVRMRDGKITPKKIGFFVAFWEKDDNNKNQAYSIYDSTDLLIINTFDHDRKGQFVFDKDILRKQGVYSCQDKKGKMSMRVYPDWSKPDSLQAKKTKSWQEKYFINFKDFTLERLKLLYKIS